MKKNHKSKSLITKLVVSLLSISLFIFIFKSDITRALSSEIKGCMNPLAKNYDSFATTDDGSCEFLDALPDVLKLAIEEFKNRKWNKNEYFLLRDKIEIHFASLNESGTRQELIALENLDLAYMIVLNNASVNAVENCFVSSYKLSQEVYKFYKRFNKKNKEIRNARGLFWKKLQITKNKAKVDKLLSNEYNREAVNNLSEEIQLFKSDNIYKEFEKCKNLKQIIENAEMNLQEFKDIHDDFRYWRKNLSKYDTEVSPLVIYKYKDYKWYNDSVLSIDSWLRDVERKRQEKIRKNDSIRDLQRKQKSNLELK